MAVGAWRTYGSTGIQSVELLAVRDLSNPGSTTTTGAAGNIANASSLMTYTLPANTMAVDDVLRVYYHWWASDSTTDNNVYVKFGSTAVAEVTYCDNYGGTRMVLIGATSLSTQRALSALRSFSGLTASPIQQTTCAEDLTANVTIDFLGNLLTGQTGTLYGTYSVELLRAPV